MKKKKISVSKVKFWLFVAFILLTLALSLSLGIFNIGHASIETLLLSKPHLSKALFTTIMTIAVATTLPVNLIALAGMFVFDFYTLLSMLLFSTIAGVLIMYLIAKKLGASGFAEYAGVEGTRLYALDRLLEKHKYPLMVLLSFVYYFPSNMAGITAAFTETKLSKFFLISFAGNAINILFAVTLVKGILINNMFVIISSSIILIASTIVPLIYYKGKLKDVFKLVFGK